MAQRSSAATFLFADIAGYTALAGAHGDEQAAELVADFAAAVESVVPSYGGTLVRSIGDALMLWVPDPGPALHLALHIVAGELMRGHGAPAVRVGLHHGPAVERDDDYFGPTVILAARVSAAAVGGEVLLTTQTAALEPDPDGAVYESRGRVALRNVREPVELVAAVPVGQSPARELPVDPVCSMVVYPSQAAGRLMFQETTYFFCTLTCAGAFAQHPERFLD
jgi:adenylate cyclase